jgi:hypothetical protein
MHERKAIARKIISVIEEFAHSRKSFHQRLCFFLHFLRYIVSNAELDPRLKTFNAADPRDSKPPASALDLTFRFPIDNSPVVSIGQVSIHRKVAAAK